LLFGSFRHRTPAPFRFADVLDVLRAHIPVFLPSVDWAPSSSSPPIPLLSSAVLRRVLRVLLPSPVSIPIDRIFVFSLSPTACMELGDPQAGSTFSDVAVEDGMGTALIIRNLDCD